MKKSYLEKFYNIHNGKDSKDKIFPIFLPLALISKIMNLENEQFLKNNYNLLPSHVDVLAALYFNNHTLSPTELYDATVFSSGGMTKILKKLEGLNYILREERPNDKRIKLVNITPSGISLFEDILEHSLVKKDLFFSALNDDEKIQLSNLLKKIAFSHMD